MWGKPELKEAYAVGMIVTAWPAALAGFLGCWGFAIWEFGWLPGLLLGWIPALIVAGIVGYAAGLLWPLLVIVLPLLVWAYLRTRA